MRALFVLAVLTVVAAWGAQQAIGASDSPAKPALAMRAEAPESVRFGDPFQVNVTITNNGTQDVRWRANALWIEPAGWDTEGMGGTGPGNGVAVTPPDGAAGKDVVIPAGGSIACNVPSDRLAQKRLGRIQAYFELRGLDAKVRDLWSKESGRATIVVQVRPSLLMESAWTAKTDEQRAAVQKEIDAWLRRSANPESEDRRTFLATLEYLGGYGLAYFEQAAGKGGPIEREWSLRLFYHAVWSVGSLNHHIKPTPRRIAPEWAKGLAEWDATAAAALYHDVAVKALSDPEPPVRAAAVGALTDRKDHDALPAVVPLAEDPQVLVRSAVLKYLSLFADDQTVAAIIARRLGDASEDVVNQALESLEHSPKAPPVHVIRESFTASHGPATLKLLSLLLEQEDADLPRTLLAGFAQRNEPQRIAILSAVAGHRDENARQLVQLGLADKSVAVQRVALARLLSYPRDSAEAMLQKYRESAKPELAPLAQAVAAELQQRKIFGFLPADAAIETLFPSTNGTVPMVSPDGKWLAYTQTGWGELGGSGGLGRSNLPSITRVVRVDGTEDRVVSHMFLAGWLADSSRLGTCRDGYAAVSDVEGGVLAEYGDPLPQAGSRPRDNRWANRQFRATLGVAMPRTRRLRVDAESDYGEHGAFSPDGKWFGPIGRKGLFLGADGSTMQISLAENQDTRGHAVWSPDGKYVACWREQEMIVLDMERKAVMQPAITIDARAYDSWEYRKCRWNPWSRDGKRLAFVRDGQVCISNPDGTNARPVTFDSTRKAWPTFSRDGLRVAYVTWQESRRRPTDVWVADLETQLAARLTSPRREQVFCLDWLDDQAIIIDRVERAETVGYTAALYTISLAARPVPVTREAAKP